MKPGNILLNCRGEIKISDFGLSAELDSTKEMCATLCAVHRHEQLRAAAPWAGWPRACGCPHPTDPPADARSTTCLYADPAPVRCSIGTHAYMSPERLGGKPYSFASDIWSLGITLVECALGQVGAPNRPRPVEATERGGGGGEKRERARRIHSYVIALYSFRAPRPLPPRQYPYTAYTGSNYFVLLSQIINDAPPQLPAASACPRPDLQILSLCTRRRRSPASASPRSILRRVSRLHRSMPLQGARASSVGGNITLPPVRAHARGCRQVSVRMPAGRAQA